MRSPTGSVPEAGFDCPCPTPIGLQFGRLQKKPKSPFGLSAATLSCLCVSQRKLTDCSTLCPEPESAPLLRMTVNREGCNKFTVTRHIGTEDVVLRNWYDEGSTTFDDYDGWTVESTHEEFFTIHPDDPNSAKCDITWMEQFSRGKWNVFLADEHYGHLDSNAFRA